MVFLCVKTKMPPSDDSAEGREVKAGVGEVKGEENGGAMEEVIGDAEAAGEQVERTEGEEGYVRTYQHAKLSSLLS